ncbi:uncharacterized protein LOC133794461 isoform X2 [Humulus lupulus]|uniref:uncharacterized protein LOC133794461 isoform X2 n=1 Tax=Humulus lupulus TaxID=3486 RepID=UPI002B41827D|nr:uncharacterized protein LOC133794461 isoform X2 [Humulus lupulus]
MQTLSVASSSSSSLSFGLRLRASWDTQPMVSYNPNAPKNPKKTPTISKNPPPTVTLTASTARMVDSISELLKRPPVPPPQGEMTKTNDLYLGYERWLPSPPKVKKPRSIYNAAALAYLGDCIYELYARRHFLFPPLSIEEFNDRVMAVVRCEAQDAVLQKLLSDNYLSQQERAEVTWEPWTYNTKLQ